MYPNPLNLVMGCYCSQNPMVKLTAKSNKGQSLMLDILLFNHCMTYIALSRVTSIEGLYLIAFDPAKKMVAQNVQLEMARLRQE